MKTQEENKKLMPEGLPYLTCGGVFFILAMILPMYRMWALLVTAAVATVICIAMLAVRRKQIAAMPEVSPLRERAEELSKNGMNFADSCLRFKIRKLQALQETWRTLSKDLLTTLRRIQRIETKSEKSRYIMCR